MRNNDSDSYFTRISDSEAIADAHLICNDMVHGAPAMDVQVKLPGISNQTFAWFQDTASANYCPPLGGSV